MHKIRIKAGETIRRTGTVATDEGVAVDLSTYTITAQIRTRTRAGLELVGSAACTIDPDQVANRGRFSFVVPASTTDDWTPGVELMMDLRFVVTGGDTTYTKTIAIDVLQPVTV